MRHEQAAAHAADGYARATGKPGATNTITGIATAYMDSVPLIVLTGQVPTHLLGLDSFQEVDIFGMTMSVTKQNYIVTAPNDLPRIIREAFHIATTGRPGPVLIDLPKDIMTALLESPYENTVQQPIYIEDNSNSILQIFFITSGLPSFQLGIQRLQGETTENVGL